MTDLINRSMAASIAQSNFEEANKTVLKQIKTAIGVQAIKGKFHVCIPCSKLAESSDIYDLVDYLRHKGFKAELDPNLIIQW